MCNAANLAGKAISISRTTAPHAVSYPFTSIYKISHGHAVSLTLEKFLFFNFKNIDHSNCNFNLKKRYDLIFNLTNTKNIIDLLMFIKKLKLECNLQDDFKKLGIKIEKDYQKIIQHVSLQRLINNPIDIKKNDLKKIILSENI